MDNQRLTVPKLQHFKSEGRRITMLTAYDATFARLLDEAQIDMLLVGDSLGMVIQGHQTTLPVTLDEMIYHTRCVVRGSSRAHVIADMPFLSYQASVEQAILSAGRLLKEAGAQSVKIEGGMETVETVDHVVKAGIPVMAHIGLRPQMVHQMGGYVVQGRHEEAGRKLLAEARAFEQAGAYALLLEGIPAPLAKSISQTVRIPTIGIGAGQGCDGQVLVVYDLLGMDKTFNPKFAKRFAELHQVIVEAAKAYAHDVREGVFPAEDNAYTS